MLGRLALPDFEEFIKEGRLGELRLALSGLPAGFLAEILADLPPTDQAVVFRILPRDEAAAAFSRLELQDQERLLHSLADEPAAAILNAMPPDDRTALLEDLPGEAAQRLLSILSPAERAVAGRLLGFPEGSVGRLMTPDCLSVPKDWMVSRALEELRLRGKELASINAVYVLEDSGKLRTVVRLRDALVAPTEQRMAEFPIWPFTSLRPEDAAEKAVSEFRRTRSFVLPVLDSSSALLGVVTLDDALHVAEEQATEDFHRLGATGAIEEPYLEISWPTMIRKRAGWLVLLFLGELLTASAMAFFEEEIAKAVVLALFVPLIISSGGNAGSQASTLIVRAMALGEAAPKDFLRIFRREAFAGLGLGLILGAIGFLRVAVWAAVFGLYGPEWTRIGLTVGLSLVGVVLWGSLAGSLFPLAIMRAGFDPALSSAPFVATLVDVTGLLIYFGLALGLLRGTLL